MQPPQPPLPAYPPAYGVPTNATDNSSALVGMILSIIALVLSWIPFIGVLGLILGIVGVVLGHSGLNRARQLPPPISRRGMAIAALVMGYLAIAVAALVSVFIVVQIHNLFQMCSATPADCG